MPTITTPPPPEDLAAVEVTGETELERVALDAGRQLPPGLATLSVQLDGDAHFLLIGRSSSAGPLPDVDEDHRKLPKIALADIARARGRTPEQVLDLVFDWSEVLAPVTVWLEKLRHHGAQLVIDDSSEREIPWELLVLAMGESDEVFLGAALATTRSLPSVKALSTGETLEPPQSPGRVLAYLADELRAAEETAGTLNMVDADALTEMTALKQSLQSGAAPYALIYLACHGYHSDSIVEVALGSRRADQLLSVGELKRRLRRTQLTSPVFINACHSARLFLDREVRSPVSRGFPAVFLDRGSPGVVGTVGEISSEFAARFAADLLRDARTSPEVALPELLRRRRAAYAEDYRQTGEADSHTLVSAFMYVFYGNPSCTVWIKEAR